MTARSIRDIPDVLCERLDRNPDLADSVRLDPSDKLEMVFELDELNRIITALGGQLRVRIVFHDATYEFES